MEKACCILRKAAAQGAQLVLFPEAFIAGYPRGLSFRMLVGSRSPEGRHVWQRYWENSIEVASPATEELGNAAREAEVMLAIGISERDGEFSHVALAHF